MQGTGCLTTHPKRRPALLDGPQVVKIDAEEGIRWQTSGGSTGTGTGEGADRSCPEVQHATGVALFLLAQRLQSTHLMIEMGTAISTTPHTAVTDATILPDVVSISMSP
jgi:hypothetical protein